MIILANMVRRMLLPAALVLATGSAVAGPLEDGIAAEDRGDWKAAFVLLEPLAKQGNPDAQNRIGYMYYNGHGVPRDYAEAMKWYRIAAAQGSAKAQTNIGFMYENRQGVPQDYAEAMNWYRKAADQGIAGAQSNIGVMYANGEGVPQDYAEATKWYRKAADQGNADAQENVTRLNEERDAAAQQKAADAYRRTPEGKQQCQANCDSARSSCKSNQIWNDTFGRASGLYMPFKNCEGEHENCVASCNNPE
jgi:TPR repeat protein